MKDLLASFSTPSRTSGHSTLQAFPSTCLQVFVLAVKDVLQDSPPGFFVFKIILFELVDNVSTF